MFNQVVIQMGFWTAWLVIPAVFELSPAIVAFFRNHFSKISSKQEYHPGRMPQLTVIVPIYNSGDTLYDCLKSIAESNYPKHLISIICTNNKSTDNSFEVYKQAQMDFRNVRMQWLEANQGKAKALNTAIYGSTGDYVFTIDSDGTLSKDALLNMAVNFNKHPEVMAQTGTILSNNELIKNSKKHRLLRLEEYYEYAIAFLAGRTVESKDDQIFTMSGAFSAFRRSALMQSRLYNVETVGEDTDMTFQIRYYLKGRVMLCPNAIFYVEPISDWDELYVQRQRWQRGEIEVIRTFLSEKLNLKRIWSNFIVRRLLVDHTVAFLKVIWLFAIFVLIPFGYSPILIVMSLLLMYLLYLFIGFLNFTNVMHYLKFDPIERKYFRNHWWITFMMPIYNLIVSFFRVMGVINTMLKSGKWQTDNFKSEYLAAKKVIKQDLKRGKRTNGKNL